MTTREVIQILMLSPFYDRMDLAARLNLFQDFCATHKELIIHHQPQELSLAAIPHHLPNRPVN